MRWLAVLSALAPGGGDVELAAGEAKARLGELAAAVTSITVEYRSYSYEAGAAPDGAYFHKHLIAVAPSSYVLESGHGYDGLDWRDDPYRQVVYVTPFEVRDETIVDRSFIRYETTPGAPLPGTLDNEFYFVATGLWPLTGRQAPGGGARAQVLADVARSERHDTVRPETEAVRGIDCHVLEWPGRDALWLDLGRGGALLRREKRDESGELTYRYELGGHERHAGSVWLPRWIVREDFEVGRPVPVRTVRMEILATSLDPVDPARLYPPLPPGAVELNREDPGALPQQRVVGGVDLIDAQCAWMSRVHPRERTAAPHRRDWALAFALSLLACVGIELGARRRRAR